MPKNNGEVWIKKATIEFSDGTVAVHEKNIFIVTPDEGWDVAASEGLVEDVILNFAYDVIDEIEGSRLEAESVTVVN
ncbi:hypothetical protein MKY96_32840 [Paenibacillus sp. FSL R7-0302]|uniref:hypothetical protein n=1 Tax=Paenibacillus sp. FSL R7-0302 TaxID=2921681 RepID=UPI0030FBD3B7